MAKYTGPLFDLSVFIERQAARQGRPLHPFGLQGTGPCCPDCVSATNIMCDVGWPVSGRLRRVLDRGLKFWEADEIATAAGVHPSDIWPDWYQHAARAAVLELEHAS